MQRSIIPLICWMLLFAIHPPMSADTPPANARDVTTIDISGDWEAAGDLPRQALLISLQGLANKHDASIYLVFPDDYTHPDVKAVLQY